MSLIYAHTDKEKMRKAVEVLEEKDEGVIGFG